MTYALDANIVSCFLNKDPQIEDQLTAAIDTGDEYVIPPFVYYEVKRWLTVKNAGAKLAIFEGLCRFHQDMVMDRLCWDKAIEIYADLVRKGRPADDGDIVIAAYCLVNGHTLVTNNMRHFEFMDGLYCVNWKR